MMQWLGLSASSAHSNDSFFRCGIKRVDLFLQRDGFFYCGDHTAKCLDLFHRQSPIVSVLQPLCQDLIAADWILPKLNRHGFKVLGAVDVETLLFGVVRDKDLQMIPVSVLRDLLGFIRWFSVYLHFK